MRRMFSFLTIYIVFSALAAIGWLVASFPDYPRSVSAWLWLLLLALPVQCLLELIGGVIWNNKASRAVEFRTAEKPFSWGRIGYGLLCFSVFFGVLFAISWVTRLTWPWILTIFR